MPSGELPSGELDVFAGVRDDVPEALADHLRGIELIDHHVHGCFNHTVDRAEFEAAINEASTDPIPSFMTQFDSPLGLSIRRWCGAANRTRAARQRRRLLGAAQRVLRRRTGQNHAACRRCRAVDRRHRVQGRSHHHPRAAHQAERRPVVGDIAASNGSPRTCWRNGTSPTDFPAALRAALRVVVDSPEVLGTKTIAAYRTGFDIDWSRPTDAEVVVKRPRVERQAPAPLRTDSAVLTRVRRARGRRPRFTHSGARRLRRPRHGSAPQRSDAAVAIAAHDGAGSGAATALLSVPASGRLSGAGVRSRELRCRAGDQLPGGAVDGTGRGGTGDGAVRQTTVLVGCLRPAGASCARLGAVASVPWGWCSEAGCGLVIAQMSMRCESST